MDQACGIDWNEITKGFDKRKFEVKNKLPEIVFIPRKQLKSWKKIKILEKMKYNQDIGFNLFSFYNWKVWKFMPFER